MIRDHQTSMTSNLISFASSVGVGFGLFAGSIEFVDGFDLGLNVEMRTVMN